MLSLLWSHAVSLLGPFVVGSLPAPEGTGGAGDEPARLVARIQAGDRAAEAELVARFSHGLLLMLRRLVQNQALADDLQHEPLWLVLGKNPRAHARERLRELWERAEKRQRFFAGAQRIVGRIGGDPARDR